MKLRDTTQGVAMKTITMVGFGSWGIALACLLAKNGHKVTMWEDNPEVAVLITADRGSKAFLPGIVIPDSVNITTNAAEVQNADIVVFAMPSHSIARNMQLLLPHLRDGVLLISTSKGLIDNKRICQYLEEIAPNCRVACMSGPSHAEEVSRQVPTAVVAASTCEVTAEVVQDVFSNDSFRVYTTCDVIGCELGGTIKNVIALAAGIVDGLGMGDNTKAALMTRGSVEIARLGVAMGAEQHTFAGLSGIGDLIVTCTSRHSRNWRAGNLLAKGYKVEQVLEEIGMVVEGIHTAKAALALAREYAVEMPIVEEVNKVLFEGKKAEDAVRDLMIRGKKDE